MTGIPVFDGHNDVLSKLHGSRPDDPVDAFINGYDAAIDLPKSVEGGFAGGFFAVYVPPVEVDHEARLAAMMAESYALPLPPELDQAHAAGIADAQIAILQQLERHQALNICRSTADIRTAMAVLAIAAILHMEGAEAIDPDLVMLDGLHDIGLRSLGPVWSRPTIFGHGVPLAFPSSPDTGRA